MTKLDFLNTKHQLLDLHEVHRVDEMWIGMTAQLGPWHTGVHAENHHGTRGTTDKTSHTEICTNKIERD